MLKMFLHRQAQDYHIVKVYQADFTTNYLKDNIARPFGSYPVLYEIQKASSCTDTSPCVSWSNKYDDPPQQL